MLSCSTRESKEQKPNIIFFLVDDQRNESLGCYGHPVIKTPAIDRLAEEGTRFTNMFVTTSICAASRASIFSGVTERTHGYTFGRPVKVVADTLARLSYPVLLKKSGYRTGFYGKFGCEMEVDKEEMFDEFEAIGGNPYFHEMPDGSLRHETDLCADRAIEFINTQPEGQPFCLSVSFNASHAEDGDKRPGTGHFPWPPSVDGMYEDIAVPPPRLDTTFYQKLPAFLAGSLNRERYFWRWDTPEKYQANIRAYFRMISGIDRAIQRVIAELEANGLADNTVIIYSADNGYYMGDRGFAGKWSHYEQSLRVPLIVYDPRLPEQKRHQVSDAMTLNIDIPATILDLAGIEIPGIYQGMSVVPVVAQNKKDNGREDFLCEHLWDFDRIPKWEGVHTGRYVYARYFGQEPPYEFLHDLEKDPDQLKNFIDDENYSKVRKQLRMRCEEITRTYDLGLQKVKDNQSD